MTLRILATLSTIFLVSSSGSCNIFSKDGKDPREFIFRGDARVQWLEPVFQIYTDYEVGFRDGSKGKGNATAFMVSPCLAFTNHHVVFGTNSSPSNDGSYPLIAAIGSNAEGMPRYYLKARPVRSGEILRRKSADWALIQIERCPGRITGWFNIAKFDTVHSPGLEVSMAGFPVGTPAGKIAYQAKCDTGSTNGATGNIEHYCASRSGSSGSPLIFFQKNIPYVLAMNVGTDREVSFIVTPEHWQARGYRPNEAVPFSYFPGNSDAFQMINQDIEGFRKRDKA